MKSKKVLGWHFCKGLTLRDGQPLIVGKTYVFKDKLELCSSGYHASVKMIDALKYAPGTVLCRVELSGEIIQGTDKLVASKRKVLWAKDIRDYLHELACTTAEAVLMITGREDDKSWDAIQAKRLWVAGMITDEQLEKAAEEAYTVYAYSYASTTFHHAIFMAECECYDYRDKLIEEINVTLEEDFL